MLFFMTRKKLDIYINDCVNKIIQQSEENEFGAELDNLKRNIASAINTLDSHDKQLNAELDRLDGQIKAFRQEDIKIDEDQISHIIEAEFNKRLEDGKRFIVDEINRKQSGISFSERDLKELVRQEVQNAAPKDSGINREQLMSELQGYVMQILNSYQNGVVLDMAGKKKKIEQLSSLLQQESNKNRELERQIVNQAGEISRLNQIVMSMRTDIDRLMAELKRLTDREDREQRLPEVPAVKHIVFDSDASENNRLLENIIEQTKLLRGKITASFAQNQDFEIYLKLVDKCIVKIEKILANNENGESEPEKIASDCGKAFKQTIAKAMSQEKLKVLLDAYMAACGFRKLDWHVGRKLTNYDYEYLEEPILYEEVNESELDGTIRRIKQDTYIMEYVDGDEKNEVIIPGIYCLGKYKK